MGNQDNHKYDDIINLPHHQSKSRPHMSMADRAAQFPPFAALSGYDEAVKETARLTDRKQELSEEDMAALSAKMALLQERINEQPEVTITYFIPDGKKDGGAYSTISGNVKRIDDFERTLTLTNQTKIPLDDIAEITGEVFVILGLDENMGEQI